MTLTAFDILQKVIDRYFEVRILWSHALDMAGTSNDDDHVRYWSSKADKYADEAVAIEIVFETIGVSYYELHRQWELYEVNPTDEQAVRACKALISTIR